MPGDHPMHGGHWTAEGMQRRPAPCPGGATLRFCSRCLHRRCCTWATASPTPATTRPRATAAPSCGWPTPRRRVRTGWGGYVLAGSQLWQGQAVRGDAWRGECVALRVAAGWWPHVQPTHVPASPLPLHSYTRGQASLPVPFPHVSPACRLLHQAASQRLDEAAHQLGVHRVRSNPNPTCAVRSAQDARRAPAPRRQPPSAPPVPPCPQFSSSVAVSVCPPSPLCLRDTILVCL